MQSFRLHDKPVDSVSLSNPRMNAYQYLDVTLRMFPSGQDHFNRTGISGIGFLFSNQTYKPPEMFGPIYFLADKYENYMNDSGKSDSTYSDEINYSKCFILRLLFLLSFSIRRRSSDFQ